MFGVCLCYGLLDCLCSLVCVCVCLCMREKAAPVAGQLKGVVVADTLCSLAGGQVKHWSSDVFVRGCVCVCVCVRVHVSSRQSTGFSLPVSGGSTDGLVESWEM